MQITKIEPQKKRNDRFNIYVNDEFACGLSKNIIIDEALAINQEINEKEIDELIEKDQSTKAMDKAIRFLGYRARTEKEIKDKLNEKEFDEKVIKKTIINLKKMGYLSDREFVESWVKDRISTKPSGKKLLSLELQKKGVSEKLTQKQLDKLVNKKTEMEMAKKALIKADKQYRNLTGQGKKQKIITYLARRGFDWPLIKELLD